jgi:hypothetical protein
MKTLIAFLIIFFVGCNLFAQDNIKISSDSDQQIKTLFKKEKRDGFYGALSAGYSSIGKKDGLTFSARGCWIMDHFFSFGVGGTCFVNGLDDISLGYNSTSENDVIKLAGGYGGIYLEPIAFPLKPVHLSFPILIGAGAVSTFNNDYDYEYFSTDNVEDFFWVIEPQVELEVNFTKWLRFAIYGGYRYTSELKIADMKDALRGYSTGLTIKMGMF